MVLYGLRSLVCPLVDPQELMFVQEQVHLWSNCRHLGAERPATDMGFPNEDMELVLSLAGECCCWIMFHFQKTVWGNSEAWVNVTTWKCGYRSENGQLQYHSICAVNVPHWHVGGVIQLLAARLKDAHSPAMRVPVAIDMTPSRAARSGAL